MRQMFALAMTDDVMGVSATVKPLSDTYGPYAFGLIAVIALVVLGLVVYTRVIAPTIKDNVAIERERTLQTAAMSATAASLERAVSEVRHTSEQQAQTAQIQAQQTEALGRIAEIMHPHGGGGDH
ncbi:MAG: hypothetical protein WAZ94_13380 [Phycisphaerales bacterium]